MIFRVAFILSGLLVVVLLAVVLLARVVSPLPPVIYGRDSGLYHLLLTCDSLLTSCGARDRLLLEGLHEVYPVTSWSPDGSIIAVRLLDARWALYDARCLISGGSCSPDYLSSNTPDLRLAWGPDGSLAAYIMGGSLTVQTRGCWEDAGGCMTWNIPAFYLGQPGWSANGHWLVLVRMPDLYRLDINCLSRAEVTDACNRALSRLPTPPGIEFWPNVSADGSRVVYFDQPSYGGTNVFLLDVATGETRQLTHRPGDAALPAWSPDERYIVYTAQVGNDLDLELLDLARGSTVRLTRQPGRDMYPSWGVPEAELGD
jgi:hypothetical protein